MCATSCRIFQAVKAPFHNVALLIDFPIAHWRTSAETAERARLRIWSSLSGMVCVMPRRRSQARIAFELYLLSPET